MLLQENQRLPEGWTWGQECDLGDPDLPGERGRFVCGHDRNGVPVRLPVRLSRYPGFALPCDSVRAWLHLEVDLLHLGVRSRQQENALGDIEKNFAGDEEIS
jgi:hypothetical protein